MKFRTTFDSPPIPFRIDHSHRILCVGSCFAENIYNKLLQYKFKALCNPAGIMYNPASIGKLLNRIGDNHFSYTEADLVHYDESWHSLEHHGAFSGRNKKKMLEEINATHFQAQVISKNLDILILTLGTAWIYRYLPDGRIVANCHKIPAQKFSKRRLGIEEIREVLSEPLDKLKEYCPNLKVLLTISPVRHTRDGMIENQRSKAALILAAEELIRQKDFVFYFPAYEYLLDDLRDYRFYKKDMVHPNSLAIDYIWEHFQQTFFTPQTSLINEELKKLKKAIDHRPFDRESSQHQTFIKNQLLHIAELERRYKFLNFSKERDYFNRQLTLE